MSARKRIGFGLDPDLPGPVEQAVADIDRRGRLRIPSRLAAGMDWLGAAAASVDALAVLDEPGRIILLSWKERSAELLAKRRALIEEAPEVDALQALRLLENRYKRINIPKELRPTLGPETLIHLDLPIGVESHVYVTRVLDALEVMSPAYRNEHFLTTSEVLAGLP